MSVAGGVSMNKRIGCMTFGVLTALALGYATAEAGDSTLRSGSLSLSNQGVRAMGFGGAMTGLADDASANFWNPAGFSTIGKGEFEASHAILYGVQGLTSQFVAYGTGNPATGGYGAAFTRLGGTIGLGEPGQSTNLWTEQSFQIGASRTLIERGFRLIGGANLRYNSVSSDLPNGSATGYGLDVGLLAQLSKAFTLGARVRDFYSTTKWNTNLTETVPFDWAIGGAYRATSTLLFAAEIDSLQDKPMKAVRAGGEYWLQDETKGPLYKELTNAAIRAGVIANLASSDTQITAGASLKFASSSGWGFGIDYAFLLDNSGLGSSHRIGISARP